MKQEEKIVPTSDRSCVVDQLYILYLQIKDPVSTSHSFSCILRPAIAELDQKARLYLDFLAEICAKYMLSRLCTK